MQKLQLERDKSWWSTLATVIPLVLGILTVLAGVASQYKQSRTQFELKAASIAFVGKTPEAVFNRAQALKRMFPKRLPDSFLKDFDSQQPGAGKEPADMKKSVLQLMLKYPDQRAEIVELLVHLFPGDHEWIDRLKSVPTPPGVSKASPAPAPGPSTQKPGGP